MTHRSVHLGDRLHLSHDLETTASAPDLARPGAGAVHPADALSIRPAGTFDASRITYRLHPTGEPAHLSGAGLSVGYLVLGVPGSGKTVLIMHLLRQILALDPPGGQRF